MWGVGRCELLLASTSGEGPCGASGRGQSSPRQQRYGTPQPCPLHLVRPVRRETADHRHHGASTLSLLPLLLLLLLLHPSSSLLGLLSASPLRLPLDRHPSRPRSSALAGCVVAQMSLRGRSQLRSPVGSIFEPRTAPPMRSGLSISRNGPPIDASLTKVTQPGTAEQPTELCLTNCVSSREVFVPQGECCGR